MIVWTIAVTAIILAAVLFSNHRNVVDQLEDDARERVATITEGVAARIDAELGRLHGLVDGIALALEAARLQVANDEVLALQMRVLREHDGVLGVGAAFEERLRPPGWRHGAPYSYRHNGQLVTVDLVTRDHAALQGDWYQLPKHLDRPVWSEPHVKQDGIKRVTYSVPIHLPSPDGPVFAGVVSADIDLQWLDQLIARQPLGEGGYGLIMTRSGTYASHPVAQMAFRETVFSIAEERGDMALRALGQSMVSGEAGLISWNNWTSAERSWLAWHPLQTTAWTMGAVVSRSALEAQMLRHSRDAALLGSAGLLLLVLAVALIARSITRPVHALSEAVATLADGNLDAPLPPPQGQDEVAHLTSAFGRMRDSLKRHIADLQSSTAARERMHSELKVAHNIQMDLVPKTFPAYPHRKDIDLSAMIVPAREVGGDFYDFFMLGDDRLVVAIGDVSGKGVPAALFMAVTRSFLRSEFKVQDDPGKVLTRVNDAIAESNESCMFVTLFCAVIHLDAGRVDYSNAGHNLPVHLRDGVLSWVPTPAGTVAAGVMPGMEYDTLSLDLQADDALLLYTDGVTEAMSPASVLYGDERLLACLKAAGKQTCEATLDTLFQDVLRHADGADQSDDITTLMFRWLPPDAASPTGMSRAQAPLTESVAAGSGYPPPAHWQAEFHPAPGELADALARFDEFLDARRVASALAHSLRFIFEEIITNAIKYGYDDGPAGHRISVHVRLDTPVVMVIEDDGRPFDPLQAPLAPDLDLSVEDRPIGGLGLYMVRTMATRMDYTRDNTLNRLTIELPAQPQA
ncbi:SpoIIE family protein phosphatase [Thauera aromatica]|uniref:SpoIIE family protein phosphatase n=1 Tax=Thauera aromatica TaxID=59405 RepID=UPI001FFDC1C1|nr:SpoIIE family protein phosphatase [Thauera aromatica]MCK2088847.1 SpoIIE family protein phosphatase [Thauera aromatica]